MGVTNGVPDTVTAARNGVTAPYVTPLHRSAQNEYGNGVTSPMGHRVTEGQGNDAPRGSAGLGGEMGKPLGVSLSDPGPLFTAGTVWVFETYRRRDAAAAMRRMNHSWRILMDAGDLDGAHQLANDAELLLEMAW